MSTQIQQGIYDLLTASSVVSELVGGRIYAVEAPVNASVPYVVIVPVASLVGRDFDGGVGGTATQSSGVEVADTLWEIEVWADRSFGVAALGAIGTAIFDTMQGTSFVVPDYDRGLSTCIDDGVVEITDKQIHLMTQWRVRGAQFPA